MNDDEEEFRKYLYRFQIVRRARILEKRSRLLADMLKEHGLGEPKSVEYSPWDQADRKRCFVNVETFCKSHGGSLETGWLFLEHEDISVFTEAHAVWLSPEGRRRDITPHFPQPDRRVLFLPDPAVAAKRGYSRFYMTILTGDPYMARIERMASELNRIKAEAFVAIGQPIELPKEVLEDGARRAGVPLTVLRYMLNKQMQGEIANYSKYGARMLP